MENLWNTGKKLALLKQYGQQRILDFQEIYNHGKEVYKINKSLLFLRKTF